MRKIVLQASAALAAMFEAVHLLDTLSAVTGWRVVGMFAAAVALGLASARLLWAAQIGYNRIAK